jgi:hypothetical protein
MLFLEEDGNYAAGPGSWLGCYTRERSPHLTRDYHATKARKYTVFRTRQVLDLYSLCFINEL